MHLSSIDKMKQFREKYLSGKEDMPLKIIDLGSMEIGGSYRPLFNEEKWEYSGLDLCAGKNVDIVLSDPYNWLEIKSESADVCISGQTFEHIEYFWKTMSEIARILRPGGLCCIIAPSGGPEHKYPVDCWRFYPDGFRALARFAHLEILEVFTQWEPRGYKDGSDLWADTVLIAEKPESEKKESVLHKEHIYKREVKSDENDTLSKIIKHLNPNTAVLELGPATGYLTEYMQKNLNCSVDCVELSPEMADIAEQYCRYMLVADLDRTDLHDHFEEKSYDYIILADVLEHLKENEKILTGCRSLLKEDGKLILSVPNIAHASVIGSLLKGKFEYSDEGLLDRTHLRFFTRKSIIELLEQSGFSIETVEVLQKLPEDTELGDSLTDLPAEFQNIIFSEKDSLSYQFVIVCGHDNGDMISVKNHDENAAGSVTDLRRAYIKGLNERISELDKELAYARLLASERLDKMNQLDNALSHAQSVVSERFSERDKIEKELAYAQQLAHERLHEKERLEQGLSSAQALVYEYSDKIKVLEKKLVYAQQLAYKYLNEKNETEKELTYAQQLAYQRLNEKNETEKELKYAQQLAYERLNEKDETEKELKYAQQLAYRRFDEIKELEERLQKLTSEYSGRINDVEKELNYARELLYVCSGEKDKTEKELQYAQKLAYERLEEKNNLENALSYAQKLAYERFDEIAEYQKRITELEESTMICKEMLMQKERILEQIQSHPGYKIFKKISGLKFEKM